MLLLNWQLSLVAFALLPVFVLLTRRVGAQRREITRVKQGSLADISTLVEESLSVSGVMLGKTMGQGDILTERFRERVRAPGGPGVAASAWPAAGSCPRSRRPSRSCRR